uniref:CCDC66 domain-containing protein n=1 Tax=Macrostomum lignano TaxID=282301 RepID=A0A1I8FQS2_9PLAT
RLRGLSIYFFCAESESASASALLHHGRKSQLFVCNGSAILTMLSSDGPRAIRAASAMASSRQQQQRRHAAAAAGNRNPVSLRLLCPPSASVADENGSAAAAGGRQRQGRGRSSKPSRRASKRTTMEPAALERARRPSGESRRRDAAAASSTANADKPATLQVHEDDIPQLSASAAAVPWRRPGQRLQARPVRVRAEEAAPRPGRHLAVQNCSAPSICSSISSSQQQQQMMQHQLKPGERGSCARLTSCTWACRRSALRSCAHALRHPNAVPLKRPQQFLSNLSSRRPQWPQPPPPPQMQQQNSQDHSRDRSRTSQKDQSRDHSRDQASVEQQQSDALRESAAQCAQAGRFKRCPGPLPRAARAANRRLRAERIQDDLEQRDAEIEELRRQVQQQQQQINEHRQQQQQQQQQPAASTASGLANADARRQAAAQLIGGSIAYRQHQGGLQGVALAVSRRRAAALSSRDGKQQQPQPAFEIFCDQSLVPQQQQQRGSKICKILKNLLLKFSATKACWPLSRKDRSRRSLKRLCPALSRCNRSSKASFKVQRRLQCSSNNTAQQQQRSNKKGLAPQMPGSAAEQKPQPPADQTT